MSGLLLSVAALATSLAATSVVIVSREEVREGRAYDVFLAPPCKDKAPICEPFERDWERGGIELQPGDIVTPEGLILREKKNA